MRELRMCLWQAVDAELCGLWTEQEELLGDEEINDSGRWPKHSHIHAGER